MSLGTVLKENRVVLAGMALPLLLVLFFVLARMIPEKFVPDPTYRAVYATSSSYGGRQFSYHVTEDGQLEVSYLTPRNVPDTSPPPANRRLFIFTPSTGDLRDFDLPVPQVKKGEEKTPVPMPAFAQYKILGQITAPDGYRYENEGYRYSSFVTDVFTRSHPPRHLIVKDKRKVPLPFGGPDSYYGYGDVVFIGWVLEERKP